MAPDAIRNEDTQNAAPSPETAAEDESPRLRGGLKRSSALQMIIAFAIIALALYGLCQLTGLSKRFAPLPMPTSTPTVAAAAAATATPVPTLAPTGTPVPTTAPSATPEPALQPGVLATVNDTGLQQLKLRSAPGLNEQLLGTLPDGSRLRVLEGPQTKDGYTWWKVQTEDGLQGWVAGDWLVPAAP